MTPIRQDEAGVWFYIEPESGAEYEIDPDEPEEVRAVKTLLEAEAADEQANESEPEDVDLRDQFLEAKEAEIDRKLTAKEVEKLDLHVQKHGQPPEDDAWVHDLDSEEGRQQYMTEAATSPTVGGYARNEEADSE